MCKIRNRINVENVKGAPKIVCYDIMGARRIVGIDEIEFIMEQGELFQNAGPFSIICRRKPRGGYDFIPIRIEKSIIRQTIERKLNNA